MYLILKNSRRHLLLYLIYILFPLQVIVSTISSYTLESFLLKGLFSFVLLIIILLSENYNKRHLRFTPPKEMLLPSVLVIVMLLISSIYSANSFFGLLKIINLTIGLIPAIIGIYFITNNYKEHIFRKVLDIYLVLGLLSIILITIFDLFDYTSIYTFSFMRWSHVIYGRFISSLALITLIVFITNKEQKYFIFFIAFLTGTVLSGYRAGVIGLVIISMLVFIFHFNEKKRLYWNIIFLTALLISISFLLRDELYQRYSSLINFITVGDYSDGAINARLTSWKLCLTIFLDNPILGAGFGSFNQPYINEAIGIQINYPHNIVIETMAELGIVGLTLLLFIISKIFKNIQKNNKLFIWYFIFALLLALFSKDLSTNTMLFCVLGLVKK